MSKVTPLPEPTIPAGEEYGEWTFTENFYIESKLKAYGAAEYQRAIEDAATELEGLRDQTGLSVSDLIRNLK
jgi:hypothetical protein